MRELDDILYAAAMVAKNMLACGATLERADLCMGHLCHAYGAHGISIVSSMASISISASKDGERAVYQTSVPPCGLDLERLKQLNDLSRSIENTHPDLASVPQMVRDIMKGKQQPWYLTLGGFLIAMACLSRIFGGGPAELVIVLLNTLILYGISLVASRFHLNRYIVNFVSMFIATGVGLLFTYVGFVQSFYIVITTNAFFLINGVGMVNAVRNILSGKESSGIIELLKVAIEIITIVAGLGAGLFAMGQWHTRLIEEIIGYAPSGWLGNIELVFLSLLASFGFGIVFCIKPRDLVFAALGGALIRIVYILMQMAVPEYRVVFTTLAAFSAALYAEILAVARKSPSTLYLYPSIVPLIPGDLFYYSALGIVWGNGEMIAKYGPDCLLQLVSMSIGFVLCSSAVFWVRKIKFAKLMASIEALIHHPHHEAKEKNSEDVHSNS